MAIGNSRTPSTQPADNASLSDAGPGNVQFSFPAGAITGDLIYFEVARHNVADIVMAVGKDGGQTWNALTLRQTGSSAKKAFWCRYDSTLVNNPTNYPIEIVTVSVANCSIEGQMLAFPPTNPANTWAIDVSEQYTNVNPPSSPFDVNRAGQTSIAASTVTIASFHALDNITWVMQGANYIQTNLGAQYRVKDATASGRDMAQSYMYKIQTVAGATGTGTNRQQTSQAGMTTIVTFKELSSGSVTISAVSDGVIHDGETGIHITCTGAGATKGAGFVKISPTNNINDASAVTQGTTSWSDTDILLSAVALSTFSYFTNIFVFVQNNAGGSNATGFPIQREAVMSWVDVLKFLNGTLQANLTNVRYRVVATSINGTLVYSGQTGTTDASANLSIPTYTLVSGGPVAPGDAVWLQLAVDGATPALSYSFSGKLVPTYS